jgi:hypothetical protein
MQSSDSKTKRTRKAVEETKAAAPNSAASSEEPAKVKRAPAAKKSQSDAVPPVKHRGSAKRAAEPIAGQVTTEAFPSVPEPLAALSAAVGSSGRSVAVDQSRVAELAYSYWEARGRQGGSPEEDWLRAEAELVSGI